MDFFDNLFDFDLKKNLAICDLNDEFFCIFLLKLYHKYNRSTIIVCNSLFDAHNIYDSLQHYLDNVALFPMDDFITSEALAVSPDLMIERVSTLKSLICNEQKVIVTNLMGYLRFLPPNNVFKYYSFTLKKGDIINPKSLVDKLISSGYNRSTLVTKTGEFSVRGFVIDFFCLGDSFPTRIEFFDDEIESIRFFDPQNQKSINSVDSVTIYPYSDFLTLNDFKLFLKENKIAFTEKNLRKFIHNFDKNNDFCLNFVISRTFCIFIASNRQSENQKREEDEDLFIVIVCSRDAFYVRMQSEYR